MTTAEGYPIEWADMFSGGGSMQTRRVALRLQIDEDVVESATGSLAEALSWLRDRENLDWQDPWGRSRRSPHTT